MTQQEVIKAFMQSLDKTTLKGAAAVNEAIKASSNFKNFAAVKKKFMSDLNSAKNWQTFLIEKCGIILDNEDTGAISGSDAGGSTAKGKFDLLPSEGEAKYPSGTSFTVGGLTIYGIPPEETLTDDQKYVIKGLYSWWIPESLALIEESYGFTFKEAKTTASRLKLKFIDDPNISGLAAIDPNNTDDEKLEARTLTVNMAYFKDMSSDDRHGQTSIGMNLDRTLLHELTHAVMVSNVDYFGKLPGFLIEGGSAELIQGLDDERRVNIIKYAQNPDILDKVLVNKSPTYPFPYEVYAGGYMFMRYFAKQAATDTTFDYDTYRKTVSVKDNFAINYYDKATMKGGKGNDSIVNSGLNVSINAGAGADKIDNYAKKVTIVAGNGNDTVNNEGANVTLSGGAGKDILLNTNGNKVSLSGDSGNDALLNMDANYVTLDGGKGNDSFVNMFNDIEKFTIGKRLSVDKNTKEPAQTSNGATLMASDGNYYSIKLNVAKYVSISGGDGNDKITNQGSYATINGGAGNDSITSCGFQAQIDGGDGNDTIINSVESLESNDTLFVSGYKSTIYGGAGDDNITNSANVVLIYGDNDNDTITNSGDNVTIYGGKGDDSVNNEGSLTDIFAGAGNDSISNSADSVSVSGENGNDFITNNGNEVTLSGGYGSDTINNYGDENLLSGMSGNDSIYNGGIMVTIDGGEGKDTILNEGVEVYISGGAGNDTINNYGNHVTLSGGAGNDLITNVNDDTNKGGKYITYEFGISDGKDTVVGFNDGDTIQITDGSYKTSKSGSDVVVKVGSSKLTLKDAVGKTINFVDAAGDTFSKTYSSTAASLLKENNFATSTSFSDLIKDNSSAYSFAELISDSTSLTKQNNLVTFGGKK